MSFVGVQLSLDSDFSMDRAVDTYAAYGLALTLEDFFISGPEVRTNYIDIAGLDGALDVSDAPQGFPVYKDRTLRFKLYPPALPYRDADLPDLEALLNGIRNDWEGVKARIVLPTDESHYYLGRIHFGDLERGSGFIVCTATVYPFKLQKVVTTVEITDLTTSWKTYNLANERRFCLPEFTLGQTTQIQMLSGITGIPPIVTLTVASGIKTFTHPDLMLTNGTSLPMQARLTAANSDPYMVIAYRQGSF